jgi:hypothetical protein
MEINRAIQRILKESNINIQSGTLVLLGIYYGLNVDEVCPEEIIKAINITKIVEKDYRTGALKWNVALFAGQELEWDWVLTKYNDMWKKTPDRKDNDRDVLKRMQKFFSMYPQYRKEDVRNATVAYHRSVNNPQYLKSSAKFIFEGIGAMQKSMLLTWCEKVTKNDRDHYQVGKIVK